MSSFVAQPQKANPQELNTTSFLSQIQPSTKKAEIYLTYDDLQKRNRIRYRRFTFFYMSLLTIFNLCYGFLAFSGRHSFLKQSFTCQLVYLFNLLFDFLFNIIFITILYRKYLRFLIEKTPNTIMGGKGLRPILHSLGWQVSVCCAFFYLVKCSCDRSLRLQLGLNFLIELTQIIMMAFLNVVHYFKIFKEIEISIALDDESVDKNQEIREERFNGSFALNLSKLGNTRKETLKYKRKHRVRTAEKAKTIVDDVTVDEITLADLDNIEIVKKKEIELQIRSLMKVNHRVTPTKKLSNEFKGISVDNDKIIIED